MSKSVNKGSSLLEPGQKVTKPVVDDDLAAKLIGTLYGLEATGIKVRTDKIDGIWEWIFLNLFNQQSKSLL